MDDLKKKYPSLHINIIEKDFGPGTKLLGLLNSGFMEYKDDTYIILMDDDLIYKPYMIEYFDNYIKSNPNIEVASYFVYNHDSIQIGQGADGFFIKQNILSHFLQYYNVIKDEDYINYHDDFYISYFFYLIKKEIYYIQLNCIVYDKHPHTYIDALYHLTGKYSRDNLNNKIYNIVTELNKNGCFDFLKS